MIPKITIRTKEERDSLVSMLGNIERGIYGKQEGVTMSEISREWGKYSWFKDLEGFLKDVTEDKRGAEERADMIKELSGQFEKLEVARISLPFSPSEKFVHNVHDILCKMGSDKLVVACELDTSVRSGAKLFYLGKYLDLTMSARISSLLAEEDAVNKYL